MNAARGLWLTAVLSSALLALSGCAILRESPPAVQAFPLNPAYTEIRADPGRVLDERAKIGHTRAGEGFAGGPTLCGFVDFKTKTVWIARDMACPLAQTRRHENCHIEARENMTVDECHDGRKF